ncbi:MAG: carboxypeptidase M32 [Rhodospirillaceae bacterium]|nr:carboxypeptidase M32 [Rhodospirillaceae bacterium]
MSANKTSAYAGLTDRFHRIAAISDAISMLSWDRQTMMPVGAAEARAEQIATLSVLKHEMMTGPEIADLIAAAGEQDLADWSLANLREIDRRYRHASALSTDLVDALSRACAVCETAWLSARPANDFDAVVKPFELVLDLTRQSADAKAQALNKTPYDALLDQFEPDGETKRVDELFDQLEPALKALLPRILDQQAMASRKREAISIPEDRQRALGLAVMEALGFEFDHGRLDTSAHPFSGGVPDDIRITTRYVEADWEFSLMGVIHETGHALYEGGLPKEWRGQPVGDARGMTIHESQSLLMEMQVSRSRPFFEFTAPLIRRTFGVDGPEWQPDSLFYSATRVEPCLIRIESDEVTYPLHVILRYRLEQAMLAGNLKPAELPGAWNDAMEFSLGIVPQDDKMGCMQDIHWYSGSIGYFPTYTLGALCAAQLFRAVRAAIPDIDERIASGQFCELLNWLRTHVHSLGSYHDTESLMENATGSAPSVVAFLDHLENRYL